MNKKIYRLITSKNYLKLVKIYHSFFGENFKKDIDDQNILFGKAVTFENKTDSISATSNQSFNLAQETDDNRKQSQAKKVELQHHETGQMIFVFY